jgi:hypothetical protein
VRKNPPLKPGKTGHLHAHDPYVLDAIDQIQNWLDAHSGRMTELDDDERLCRHLRRLGNDLAQYDERGMADDANACVTELAALAIFYLARGLS